MAIENILGCCIKAFFPFNVDKAHVTSVHKMGGKTGIVMRELLSVSGAGAPGQ